MRRGYADDSSNTKNEPTPKGPNTEPLPHVSEEASEMAKIQGKQSPEIEQGTPVEEVGGRLGCGLGGWSCAQRTSKETVG